MQLPVLLLALLSGVSADPLLVLSTPSLVHEASSASFSPAGMAQLALDALGVATGRVSSGSAPQSPLQADLFTHADAYALLLLEENAVNAVDAAVSSSSVYHQLFQGKSASVKVPAAVAQELQDKHPDNNVRCAGSVALCGSIKAWTPEVDAELLQSVLRGNSFLDAADAEDVAFAKQLTQVAQLTAALKQDDQKLFVVGISSLTNGEKQRLAAQAAATTVAEFLAQLVKTRAAVGAQVMTGKLPVAVQEVAALSRRARNRRLVTSLNRNKDEDDDEEEEDDDEEVEDLAEESGSAWEDDDDNSTTTTNSTASPVTMPDIAEYQIILWTSVLLGAILVISVLAMGNMTTGRDSLLYAKFIADVNGRKTN